MARRTVVLCIGRKAYRVLGDRRAKMVGSVMRISTGCHETYVWIRSEVAPESHNVRFLRRQTSQLMGYTVLRAKCLPYPPKLLTS